MTILSEGPSANEAKSLPVHVEKCHLRYMSISKELHGIKKILWAVAMLLLISAVSTNIAVWLGT